MTVRVTNDTSKIAALAADIPSVSTDRGSSDNFTRAGIYGSNDGVAWQYHPFAQFSEVNRGFAYVRALSDDSQWTWIKQPRKERADRVKADLKIGSFKVNFTGTYTLRGRRSKRGSAFSFERVVSGMSLLATIHELQTSKNCVDFMVDLTPLPRSAVKTALVNAGLLQEKAAQEFKPSSVIDLAVWHDRSYTWFTVTVDGNPITDDHAIKGLLGVTFRTSAKESLGNGAIRHTATRRDGLPGGWFIPRRIDAYKLATWVDGLRSEEATVNLDYRGDVLDYRSDVDAPVNTDGDVDRSKDDHDDHAPTQATGDTIQLTKADLDSLIADAIQSAFAKLGK